MNVSFFTTEQDKLDNSVIKKYAISFTSPSKLGRFWSRHYHNNSEIIQILLFMIRLVKENVMWFHPTDVNMGEMVWGSFEPVCGNFVSHPPVAGYGRGPLHQFDFGGFGWVCIQQLMHWHICTLFSLLQASVLAMCNMAAPFTLLVLCWAFRPTCSENPPEWFHNISTDLFHLPGDIMLGGLFPINMLSSNLSQRREPDNISCER